MGFPATAWATSDLVSADQLNGLPVRIADVNFTDFSLSSVNFASVPDHYAHLLIVAYLRSDTAATSVAANLRFNGDAGSNYDHQFLYGSAATASAGETFGATSAQVGNCPAASAGANLFSALRVLVPRYAQASDNKAVLSRWGMKTGTASGDLQRGSIAAFWRSSDAITSITIEPATGNVAVGCRATLYGLP